jgi:cytidine deaminase
LTICAERTALVRLIAQGESPDAVEAIAVHVDGANGQPCGACRQFLAELIPAARISYIADGEPVTRTVIDLLPDAFVPGALAP